MKSEIKNLRLPALIAAALCATLSTYAVPASVDGTVSPVQSKADPLQLSIVGPVMAAGSDAASKQFDNTVLPSAIKYVLANLPEGQNNSLSQPVVAVDPAKLVLASKTDLQAIFIDEGAGYHNTLGFNTTGIGTQSGDPQIIFPDVSSTVGYGGAGTGTRTPSEPLLPGDFVDLGTYNAGTKLNFFIISNGANGGSSVFSSAGAASNPDDFQHVGMFTPNMFAVPQLNSPYIFVTFEDLYGGGDKDYNDVVFAFNVGAATVHSLLATPEPSMYLTLGGFLAMGIWAKRRMDRLAAVRQA